MKGVIMLRHRLTDEQWALISDLFADPKRTGRPPRDRRTVMDGILWILHTRSPWRDLPEPFGPWRTAWHLFDKWNEDGTLGRILDRLRNTDAIDEQLWCIDGTIVRAARCAAGGGKRGIPTSRTIMRLAAAEAV
jgi:transposase